MSTPEKLKKYQKEKFKNYKEINELKINDDEIYIDLKVNDLNSIINEFSTSDKLILKKEFYEAIENSASFIPLDYPLVLEIHSKNINSEEKIIIRRLIKNHFRLLAITKEMELKSIRRKSHFFLMCGLLCFSLLMLAYIKDLLPYLREIISFIASFSIWEFAELVIFEQDSLKEEIIKYNHLSKVRIVYNKEIS